MGTYTCKDCKVQCMERSREYICTSFKPQTAPAKRTARMKDNGSKSNRVKSEANTDASDSLRKEA